MENKKLQNRLVSLQQIFSNPNMSYPLQLYMLGFPLLKIHSKEELDGRVKELQDILNVDLEEDGDDK